MSGGSAPKYLRISTEPPTTRELEALGFNPGYRPTPDQLSRHRHIRAQAASERRAFQATHPRDAFGRFLPRRRARTRARA